MPRTAELTDESRRDPWVAPILSVAQLVSWGSMFYAFAIVLEPMASEFGASRTQLSSTYSIGLLTLGFAAWPVGILIDKGFIREIMSAGSFLGAIGLVTLGLADSISTLYGAWLLLGIAMACTLYEPVFSAMVRAYPHSYRTRITVITLLGGLASTAFWPLTAALTERLGWRDAVMVLAALQVLVCAPIHWFALPATDPKVADATRNDRSSTFELVRSKLFIQLTLSLATHLFVMAAVAALLVGMLASLGLSHAWVLVIVACIGPMQVAGRIALFVSEKRWSSDGLTRLILWLPAISIGLFTWLSVVDAPSWVALALLAAAVYGAGNGMLTIIRGTAIADMVGPSRVATLNGIASVPGALARAAGPFVIAAIWEQSGSVTPALVATFLAAAASALTFFSAQAAARTRN